MGSSGSLRGRHSEPLDFWSTTNCDKLLALFLHPYMRGDFGFEPNIVMRDTPDDNGNGPEAKCHLLTSFRKVVVPNVGRSPTCRIIFKFAF